MYCPQCKAEYRQGFTRCSDCDAELVHELPSQAPRKVRAAEAPLTILEGVELRALQRWTDSVACADACLKLRDAGIAYRVKEISHALGFQMVPRHEFEIAVPIEKYERAKEFLGIQFELGDEENMPSEEEIHAVMELREDGEGTPESREQDGRDLTNWYPEDAVVQVWSGRDLDVASDKSWMIELGLKENRILFRADVQEDGSHSLFVRPEDEAGAREIVREIVEGAPPE